MAQHDHVIDNATPANVRADLNNALSAIATNNSGSSAPSTIYANQWWYDTTNDILKIRNEANTAWISVGYVNQSSDKFEPFIDGIQVTDFLDEDNMSSDSATAVASQQSVKAYADSLATQWLTEQATTSGTAVDFSVPSTAREITVHFIGTSLTSTDSLLIQIIDGGTPTTTGYKSDAATNAGTYSNTSGFLVKRSTASQAAHGHMLITRPASGTYVSSHSVGMDTSESSGGGILTGVTSLTGIRVTGSGAGSFDAGSVNVSYR